MLDVETVFEEFDGRDRYEDALIDWSIWKAHRYNACKQAYYDRNRKHMREVWRRNSKAYRARKGAKTRGTNEFSHPVESCE